MIFNGLHLLMLVTVLAVIYCLTLAYFSRKEVKRVTEEYYKENNKRTIKFFKEGSL